MILAFLGLPLEPEVSLGATHYESVYYLNDIGIRAWPLTFLSVGAFGLFAPYPPKPTREREGGALWLTIAATAPPARPAISVWAMVWRGQAGVELLPGGGVELLYSAGMTRLAPGIFAIYEDGAFVPWIRLGFAYSP